MQMMRRLKLTAFGTGLLLSPLRQFPHTIRFCNHRAAVLFVNRFLRVCLPMVSPILK